MPAEPSNPTDPEPFFRLLEIDIAELSRHSNALDRMRRGELHGVLVHNLYDLPLFLLYSRENPIVILGLYVFFVILLRYLYTRARAIVADLQARQPEISGKGASGPGT